MIIIPDIHGRTFWEEAVKDRETEQIIFLGDYIDPYLNEGISHEAALQNFKEIIEFKKAHMDNVILLLGNHDFGPYIHKEMTACRTNYKDKNEISKLYYDNLSLFKVAHYQTIDGVNYTFTHAAIEKDWCEMYYPMMNIYKIIDKMNEQLQTDIESLVNGLSVVSRYRGGWGWYASPVWADVRELNEDMPEFDYIYQVFGHTQLRSEIITTHFACLDCRRAFTIIDGEFMPITKENII